MTEIYDDVDDDDLDYEIDDGDDDPGNDSFVC